MNAQSKKMIQDFIEYVYDFYGPGMIYDLGFTITHTDIARATAIRLRTQNPNMPFDGDSVDRETVRDILVMMLKPLPTIVDHSESVETVYTNEI